MFTRYNFGAARDPEMPHKIYNAEPVAPIIEIPRRDNTVLYSKRVILLTSKCPREGDTLICSRYIDKAAFEAAIFAAFKLKLYYFSKALILVQF